MTILNRKRRNKYHVDEQQKKNLKKQYPSEETHVIMEKTTNLNF